MDEPDDTLAVLKAEVDQHVANAPDIARAVYAEFQALVDEGMPVTAAALFLGQRYRFGGGA